MEKIKKFIEDPRDLITLHKFNDLMKDTSNEPRLCKVHKKAVDLNYELYTGDSFGAVPFAAWLSGCCEDAVKTNGNLLTKSLIMPIEKHKPQLIALCQSYELQKLNENEKIVSNLSEFFIIFVLRFSNKQKW